MRLPISRSAAILCGFFIVACSGFPGPGDGSPAPDTVLYNGKIVTVDGRFSIAQAVAIRDGKFAAVGGNDQVRRLAGASTRSIDLQGRTVLPGLMDGHLHNAGGGPGVDLSRVRSMEELLAAVAARVKASKPGELVVSNNDWHEAQLKEKRLPHLRDLDRVAPDNPVVLVRGGHEFILNSAGLQRWKITRATKSPDGGEIGHDVDGGLNGELIDNARRLVTLPPAPRLTPETVLAQIRILNASGITSIRIPGSFIFGSDPIETWNMLRELKAKNQLSVRVNYLLRILDYSSVERVRETLAKWAIKPDEGDEWLRIGGMKTGVDGGFEGGHMHDAYEEPHGKGGNFKGIRTVPQDRYTAVVRELNRQGWRVATHAVGDAAVDQVLEAYSAADRDQSIRGKRWSIEHFFVARPEQFPRARSLDLVISAQNHLYLAGPSLVKYWGRTRAHQVTPVRAFLDQGFIVAGGTDSPVIPYSPFWAMYHFISRETISDGVYGANQRISREEALKIFTINNAKLTFEENIKGSIEPGKLADLVIVSGDFLTVPEKQIENLKALGTMVGGRFVYSDPALALN
ncbi:MAG: amidohydrolase [Betaproteobacteria bacterium]|nr:amidohydrolase [Betaproteobacteria bacterium]